MQISRGDSKTTELNWNGFILLFFYYYSFCSSFVCYCKFNDLFIVFFSRIFSVGSIYLFFFFVLFTLNFPLHAWRMETRDRTHEKKSQQ